MWAGPSYQDSIFWGSCKFCDQNYWHRQLKMLMEKVFFKKNAYIDHLHICPSAWSGLWQTSALLPHRHCWIQWPFPWRPNRSPNSCHGDKVPAAVNIRPLIFCSVINSSCAISQLIDFISAPSDTVWPNNSAFILPSWIPSIFILLLSRHACMNATLIVLKLSAPLAQTQSSHCHFF